MFGVRSGFVRIQIIKFLVFMALLGGFYSFDGFDRPAVTQADYRSSRGLGRAWIVTVIMFVAGAIFTLWGNAIARQVDWDIPEGVYPIFGVLLLVAGFVWMLMVRGSVRI